MTMTSGLARSEHIRGQCSSSLLKTQTQCYYERYLRVKKVEKIFQTKTNWRVQSILNRRLFVEFNLFERIFIFIFISNLRAEQTKGKLLQSRYMLSIFSAFTWRVLFNLKGGGEHVTSASHTFLWHYRPHRYIL